MKGENEQLNRAAFPDTGKVLVIDDDAEVRDAVEQVVRRMGHAVTTAASLTEGRKRLSAEFFDVVLLDVKLPDGNGLDALSDIQRADCRPEVIVMTGYGDPDGAESAVRSGAWDYLEKPVSVASMRTVLSRVLQYRGEQSAQLLSTEFEADEIVGGSAAMQECRDRAAQASAGDVNVLIAGDTGTGKELFARAIHDNSPRRQGRFVVVDCTALPKTLVESELFGHVRGAYTGADQSKEGLVKQAHGGTLFLDEVGEMPIEIQKKFLRVLQERRYRPVGSEQESVSDFRLIAATHRDLEALAAEGRFREDLLFRLRAMTISLPPLYERRADIRPLALHRIALLCRRYRLPKREFSADFFDTLAAYDWPGNVRELHQALETALVSSSARPMLFPKDLPAEIRAKVARKSIVDTGDTDLAIPLANREGAALPPLQEVRLAALADTERRYLELLLEKCVGDIRSACRISGLSRSRLYTLLKKYEISPSRVRRLGRSDNAS